MRKSLVLLVLLTFVSACAASRESGFDKPLDGQDDGAATVEGNVEEVKAQADEAWEERGDVEKLEEAIALYTQAVQMEPNNVALYERLSRATYFLADAYLRDDRDRQEATHNKSIEWGERCLALDPQFKAKIDSGAKVDEAVKLVGEEYTGCIYWQAAALGKWATLKGFATRLANKDRILNLITRVTELDKNFFYGAPDRYWGAYYALIPGFMGKDLEKSRKHFESSLEAAPDYLGTKVLMADPLAVEKQDRAMYKALLEEVIAADPSANPEVEPENRAEQVKAKELLAQIDDKIPE